jgi:integrase
MPLEPFKRGEIWWAKGRVELNGRPITEYIRESTRSSDESGARDWITQREEAERRRHFLGEEPDLLTFADAVTLYTPTRDMAKYLIPILRQLGPKLLRDITPKMVRDLGPKLYPNNSTDTWRRWVIAPARAVINNALDDSDGRAFRISGYTREERIAQDRKRGKKSRVKKTPGSWEWLLKFRQHASQRHAALALFMFATGARVGQSTAMRPENLKLDEGKAIIPGAKGHDDRVISLAPELIEELRVLKPRYPR